MSAHHTTPTSDILTSEKAVAHVHQILSLFQSEFRQPLDLEVPDHFLKLASIANLREWESNVVQRGGRLEFDRYDIACLCVQDHLKRQMPSLLLPDQQHSLVDALFPRLYSMSPEEYPRMIRDLQHLTKTCAEQALTAEFRRICEATDRILLSRDQSIIKDGEMYSESFDDAFHNSLLKNGAPWHYDMVTRISPASVEDVINVLVGRLSRIIT